MIPHIFSHYTSKSIKGSDFCTCLGKKSQESDISRICPDVPVNEFLPNLACGVDTWT